MPKRAEQRCVVLVVEDPGALNFLLPLIDALTKQRIILRLLGIGFAYNYLSQHGYCVEHLTPHCNHTEMLISCECKLVITGTSEDRHTPALELLQAASLLGINTVGVVDASVNSQYRFCGSSDEPLNKAPDWLIVPDHSTAQAFKDLGFVPERIFQVGNPARDLAREKASKLQNSIQRYTNPKPRDSSRVVFVSELSEGLDTGQYRRSTDYTLLGRGASFKRSAIVAEEVLDALSDVHDIKIVSVLRLHPKESISDLGAICDEFHEISTGGDPLELVATADLVIGMTSMLLVQSHDMGIQCLSVLPRKEEIAWIPEISSGLIPCATDRASLRAKINNLLHSNTSENVNSKIVDPKPRAITLMTRIILDLISLRCF